MDRARQRLYRNYQYCLGAQPTVGRVEPLGVQRGGLRTFVLKGARLKDAKQVLVYEPGLTIKEVKPLDDAQVEVQVEVAPDCRIGLHAVQLVTGSGVANLRLLSIGNLPEVAEVEPNGDFAKPQEITVGSTVSGIVKNEDEDFFAIDLKAGQRLVLEVEGVRGWAGLRNDFFDPYVAVLDANRYEQVVADDVPLLYQDPVCTFTAPADGRYTIVVRDSAYGGADDYAYRLHVGLFPRPFAVLPAGGQPGQVVEASFIESDGNIIKRQVQLPSTADKAFPLMLDNEGGIAPSPNWVRSHRIKSSSKTNPTTTTSNRPWVLCLLHSADRLVHRRTKTGLNSMPSKGRSSTSKSTHARYSALHSTVS